MLATVKVGLDTLEQASPPACRPTLTVAARVGKCAAIAWDDTPAAELRIGTQA